MFLSSFFFLPFVRSFFFSAFFLQLVRKNYGITPWIDWLVGTAQLVGKGKGTVRKGKGKETVGKGTAEDGKGTAGKGENGSGKTAVAGGGNSDAGGARPKHATIDAPPVL